jgi:hypothetical protein
LQACAICTKCRQGILVVRGPSSAEYEAAHIQLSTNGATRSRRNSFSRAPRPRAPTRHDGGGDQFRQRPSYSATPGKIPPQCCQAHRSISAFRSRAALKDVVLAIDECESSRRPEAGRQCQCAPVAIRLRGKAAASAT